MKMKDIVDFCEQYVLIFLDIVNFNGGDNFVQINDIQREKTMEELENKFENDRKKLNDRIEYFNNLYDNELFNFVEKNISNEYPEYFNSNISKLAKLLDNNLDYVKILNMISPVDSALSFKDYYNNYLIVLDYLISLDNKTE